MADAAVPRGRLAVDHYLEEGARRGIQWTLLRKAVLRFLWRVGRPVGAYDVAARLKLGSRRVHPNSVYRCFHCLQRAGLVIPVLSWNRFMLSPDPEVTLWGLLLCRRCGGCTSVDLTSRQAEVERAALAAAFVYRRCAVECQGVCRRCRGERRSA